MPPKSKAAPVNEEVDNEDDVVDADEGDSNVNDAAAFASDFTYPFLKGLPTFGLNRPRRIHIPTDALDRMTGMERQFWEIKMKFFDVVIFFKKGKFYELYDTDAVIGNREFGLKMVQDLNNRGKMRMSGVPEQSFAEWSRLFVFKGYKVGKVEQMAIDESLIGTPKEPKCIPRALVSIYTRGTITDSSMLAGADANYVAAFAQNRNQVDAVAFDISRRVFWHAQCASVDEVAALLHQLCPVEVICAPAFDALFDGEMSRDDFRNLATSVNPDCVVEDISTLPFDVTVDHIQQHPDAFSSPALSVAQDYLLYLKQNVAILPRRLLKEVSPAAFCTYTAHVHQLVPALNVDVERPILATERDCDHGMAIDAAAIENLELTSNLRDGSRAGSLLHYFTGGGRHVATPGGQRLMRQWLLRPSAHHKVITSRQQVVAAFAGVAVGDIGSNHASIGTETRLMSLWKSAVSDKGDGSKAKQPKLSTLDLERLLGRVSEIANIDSRVSFADPLVMYPKHLTTLDHALTAFQTVATVADTMSSWLSSVPMPKPGSDLMRELLAPCLTIREPIEKILSTVFRRSRIFGPDNGFVIPNSRDECPEYFDACTQIEDAETELAKRLTKYEKMLGCSLSYSDLGKDLFLLDVPTKHTSSLEKCGFAPGELKERARTQKAVKYQVVSAASIVANLKKATLLKQQALISVLKNIASQMCSVWPELFCASTSIAYIDCLAALAEVATQSACLAPVCLPSLRRAEAASISLTNAYHPLVLMQSGKSVPNTLTLDASSGKVLVLTGPNMAGKSTLMRCIAVAAITAQLGGFVNAEACTIEGPIDRIFTRIGARDATHRGASTLHVELSEMATIHRCATALSLCLVDELGRGTSTHDGYAIAHASLMGLAADARAPLSVFSTHYHGLALEVLHQKGSDATTAPLSVQLGYMDFRATPPAALTANAGQKRERETEGGNTSGITFLYRLVPGVCSRSYGVEVAIRAGITERVIETARRMSEALRVAAGDVELIAMARDLVKGNSAHAACRAKQLLAISE